MGRPYQQTERPAWQNRSPHHRLIAVPAIALLLVFPGCAQLDQLMGKQPEAVEPAQPVQTVEPVPNAATQEQNQIPASQPALKPVVKKRSEESQPVSGAKEPPVPLNAPAQPAPPVAGMTKQPEPTAKQPEQDKTLSQKDQPPAEKKSRMASDKKSKKSPKSKAESKPQTEDVFLPPVPLPSKPAAIGGSGG